MTRSSVRWFTCYRPQLLPKLRLFCLPFAGASAYAYRDWVDWIPGSIELYAAQLPGRGPRIAEPALERMDDLIEALCAAMVPLLDGPFAVYGHSTGGIVGYELCVALQRRGHMAAGLFVSACEAPDTRGEYPPLHLLSDDELIEELRSLGGTPSDLLEHPGARETLIPPLRADFAVAHEPRESEPPIRCSIITYAALSDPLVRHYALDRWQRFTAAEHHIASFEGDHWFVLEDGPFRARLVQDLLQCPRLDVSG